MSDRRIFSPPVEDPHDLMPMGEAGADEISKTVRKRDAHAAQDLGARLIALDHAQLDTFSLSDALLVALKEARGITAHGARKRHLQYIGKLMRHHDVEVIEQQLAHIDPDAPHNVRLMHESEQWRTRLLEEGPGAVTAFVADYPAIDVQALRQLLRQVAKERTEQKPPRYYRELYRFVRDGLAEASAPD